MEASSELVECGHKSWLAGSMKKKNTKNSCLQLWEIYLLKAIHFI